MMRISAVALAAALVLPAAGQAQQSGTNGSARAAATPVPFGVGESAVYRVNYGVLGRVGTGTMDVLGVDTVRGHPTYHLFFTLQGGIPLARVDNSFESWLDVRGLFSRRFDQDTKEANFKRRRAREFFPEERRWTGHTNGNAETGTLPSATPLDDTSFLYYVRTLELEVGREYTFNHYWNESGNPVRIRVLRRETVRVPAGTFQTIVVQPLIRTSGLFSEGGEAEVYFSDDERRILVALNARVTFGTLRLQLESYTAGERLAAAPFRPLPPRP